MNQIVSRYAALTLIEILYKNELINKETYEAIQNKYKPQKAEGRMNNAKHNNCTQTAV